VLTLNAPFLPEAAYVEFLGGLGERLHAVHFSLYDAALCDARVRLRDVSIETLADHLARLPGPKKYLLANGRFQAGETYMGGGGLPRLIERLEMLLDAGVLDGLIFADSYLLTALGDAAPALAAALEAVPSVNFIIDGLEKVGVLVDLVAAHGFRPPGKLSLDRGLNRRPERLTALSKAIRRHWPKMKIELLANEGCLNHCPYRSTHEALIAAVNSGLPMDTHRLNRDLACLRILHREPHRIIASPFIRPEDVRRYEAVADLIKVCGRTLGIAFLKRVVGAYASGGYAGNLFDLFDASHWMAERWELPNSELPKGLLTTLSSCGQRCGPPGDPHGDTCTTCEKLFARYARSRPLELRDLRDGSREEESGA
jgi:collagenase-like PrtC family protease